MKTSTTSLSLIVCVWLGIGAELSAGDLPMFGKLPDPGKHWSMKNAGRPKDGSFSWVNFDNVQSGDVLAVVAWKRPGLKVEHDPVRQASIETFTHDGYACLSTRSRAAPIAETIRNQIVSIDITNHSADKKFNEKAIEFSYIYENDRGSPSTMAHGYVVVVGDFAVFIQHTSKHVITSALASEMVFGILWQHFANTTSIQSGWCAMINRDLR